MHKIGSAYELMFPKQSKNISCLLFSLVFAGVGGNSSGQEDVLCCGWGPISDYRSSYRCFSADISPGCCAGKT